MLTITQHLLLAGAKQTLMAAIGVIIRQIAQIGQQLVLHGLLLIHMGTVLKIKTADRIIISLWRHTV